MVYRLSYAVAAKQQTAFPSPADFNLYAQLANVDLYNYYNDEREKLLLKVKSGEQIYIPNTLNDFVVTASVPVIGGNAGFPANYEYWLSLTSPSAQADILKVDYSKLGNYLNSTIDNPTYDFPIFVEYSDYFGIHPPDIPYIGLTYLQAPNTVIWAYDVVNGRPVYNSLNSVNFLWSDTELYRITSRVLFYMGLSIRDDILERTAQEMIQTAS